ncbi:MAG: glycosyltransferase family 9 protein [Flavobacteriales bacterium]
MSEQTTRILVIRFSSIGDILLTAPALESLRNAVHGPCEIHFLTKTKMKPVVQGFGKLVDHIHTIENSTAEVSKSLLGLDLHYIVDLHNNVRSRSIKRTLGLIAFTVDKQNWAKWLLVRGWRTQPISHIVHRYIESFSDAFGAAMPNAWPKIFTEATHAFDLPEEYAVIALGAAHEGKKLPDALIDSIIQHSQTPVILIGGPEEMNRGAAFQVNHPNAISLAGQTSIEESAAIIRAARQVFSGDTGMMHLASAMGVPVTSFWGCTRPSLGMAPWAPSPGSEVVVPDDLIGSRPCSKLGNRCRNQANCMESTQAVFLRNSVKEGL